MTQYAYYDSTIPSPSPVRGWYDTESLDYSQLPAKSCLFEVTSEQWAARMSNNGQWAISDNTLIEYTAPPPIYSLSQQALQALNLGLTVYSTSVPEFNGIYPVDPIAQGKIGAISTYILVNNKFPGGLESYPWLDIAGTVHVIASKSMFQEFATQAADYVAALDFISATGEGELPSNVVIIS